MTKEEEIANAIQEINEKWAVKEVFKCIEEFASISIKDKLIIIRPVSVPALSEILKKLIPTNTTITLGTIGLIVNSPYTIQISNPSSTTIKTSLTIRYKYIYYDIYISVDDIEVLYGLKVLRGSNAIRVFNRGTHSVPDTGHIFYPGRAAHEIEKIRIPGVYFNRLFSTPKMYYGNHETLMYPDSITEFIQAIHDYVHTQNSDAQQSN
jgi:hypothetical protein